MHLEIYKRRSDINSIVHVHSPYATAFAMIGKGMEELIMPEVVVTLGKIPLVPYKTPSTQEFAEIVAEFASKWDSLLLERHGVVTLGSDLRDAYYKLERTEHVFKMLSIARSIGDIKSLTSEEVSDLLPDGGYKSVLSAAAFLVIHCLVANSSDIIRGKTKCKRERTFTGKRTGSYYY
jgi:L-fuculose-phosphate aldolase